jgi:DNA-binding NarL/FixJ family response regulator
MRIILYGVPPLAALGIGTVLGGLAEPVAVEPAEDRDHAYRLARDGGVDLAIVDPYRPTLDDGLRFCQELKQLRYPPYVLGFANAGGRTELMYYLLAGIDSFVRSDEPVDRFAEAVRATLDGRRQWLLGESVEAAGDPAELTPREREVLWMLRERYTNKQIGRRLSISPNTAKNHVAAILRKLGAQDRYELLAGGSARGRAAG